MAVLWKTVGKPASRAPVKAAPTGPKVSIGRVGGGTAPTFPTLLGILPIVHHWIAGHCRRRAGVVIGVHGVGTRPGDGPSQPGEFAEVGHHGLALQGLLERRNVSEGNEEEDDDVLFIPYGHHFLL